MRNDIEFMPLTVTLTCLSLVAFAANSIFCRMALLSDTIGPLEFTIIRLVSGMLILLPIIIFNKELSKSKGAQTTSRSEALSVNLINFSPSLFLFSYALFFSLAYIQLEASVGALILFASVQITMMGVSIYHGNQVAVIEWIGFGLAFAGFLYLILPGLSAPPVTGTVMMVVSGISWGLYSLRGKGQERPIFSTARNFLYCLPACVLLLLVAYGTSGDEGRIVAQPQGVALAVLSGALASGVGYVLWFVSLRRITITVASIAQLSVPILAAIGGILFLNESLSIRLLISTFLILGGIVITIAGKRSLT